MTSTNLILDLEDELDGVNPYTGTLTQELDWRDYNDSTDDDLPSTQLPSTQLPSTQLPSTQLPSTQLPSTQLPDDKDATQLSDNQDTTNLPDDAGSGIGAQSQKSNGNPDVINSSNAVSLFLSNYGIPAVFCR